MYYIPRMRNFTGVRRAIYCTPMTGGNPHLGLFLGGFGGVLTVFSSEASSLASDWVGSASTLLGFSSLAPREGDVWVFGKEDYARQEEGLMDNDFVTNIWCKHYKLHDESSNLLEMGENNLSNYITHTLAHFPLSIES